MNNEAIIIGRIKNCGGGFIKFLKWENRKCTVQGLSCCTNLIFQVYVECFIFMASLKLEQMDRSVR